MSTNNIIRSLRALRVLVLHPRDNQAEELLRQISRIGCRGAAIWPPPEKLPDEGDVVFVEVKETISKDIRRLFDIDRSHRPTVIGVVAYENPSVLQGLLDLEVDAVVTVPLRPFGVLSSMVIARRVSQEFKVADRTLGKLKRKFDSVHKISQAKFILMKLHGLSEEEAYGTIRTQAMTKRTTMADIAQAIINADGILGSTAGQRKPERLKLTVTGD